MPSRRAILSLIGGGAVLAATAAGGFVALNQPSHAARAAWREAGLPQEARRRFLSFALLAPNPHNMQPWAARLEGDDSLSLYCDLDRRLPETDPFDRQTLIGHGCFMELFALAAAQEGYAAEIDLFPEGAPEMTARLDARPVARVRLREGGATPDPLFAHVLSRRTNRNAYDAREVPPGALAALAAAGASYGMTAHAIGEGETAAALRDLTWRAHEVEVLTPATWKESLDVMRIGAGEVARHRDGLSLEGPMLGALSAAGILTRETLADPSSQAFRQGLDMYRPLAASARAFAWIANDGASREGEIAAGRAYMRLALTAEALGLAIHPWSQALQEYAEMEALYEEVHALIGGGQRLQMLVRAGYASPVVPAPRRGLSALFDGEA
ncbi:Acg family FMN-binding oxidoreductase [Hyphomonas sp.]|uniref:Acg family FMN-binding oxidoreductase n=1 Tax=Hyphomonas sp. TaxID=87 RepID=UPI00391D1E73